MCCRPIWRVLKPVSCILRSRLSVTFKIDDLLNSRTSVELKQVSYQSGSGVTVKLNFEVLLLEFLKQAYIEHNSEKHVQTGVSFI